VYNTIQNKKIVFQAQIYASCTGINNAVDSYAAETNKEKKTGIYWCWKVNFATDFSEYTYY